MMKAFTVYGVEVTYDHLTAIWNEVAVSPRRVRRTWDPEVAHLIDYEFVHKHDLYQPMMNALQISPIQDIDNKKGIFVGMLGDLLGQRLINDAIKKGIIKKEARGRYSWNRREQHYHKRILKQPWVGEEGWKYPTQNIKVLAKGF
jgi:hypothetical protein